jgi:hypothetical protein
MPALANQTFSSCPACQKADTLQYLTSAVIWRRLAGVSFSEEGFPSFDHARHKWQSGFEGSDRYEFELIECRECYHVIASRPAGYDDWIAGPDRPEDLEIQFEQLCGEFLKAGVACDSHVVLKPLCNKAEALLALAGRGEILEEAAKCRR